MEESLNRKDLITMKLLHYFMIEKNYKPIILQGIDNEIWLENLEEDYKIIRIVSKYIHNNEQLNLYEFRAKRIADKIKKKTLSFSINYFNIYLDLGENVNNLQNNSTFVYNDEDILNNDSLIEKYPDIKDKLTFTEEGMELFIKMSNDLNNKSIDSEKQAEDIFKPKKAIVTYILMGINILLFCIPFLLNIYNDFVYDYALIPSFIRSGEYYRLFTAMFLHANLYHLFFNMYSLYIIGSQLESFIGKTRFLIVYLLSGLMGSLMSMVFQNHISIGASGAIFGLMGSLLYFGYHYRLYLASVIKSQIIPLIIFNLCYGFLIPGIDNYAHIGGLLGGFLTTISVGIKYKSSRFEMINGIIVNILAFIFLIYMAIFIPR